MFLVQKSLALITIWFGRYLWLTHWSEPDHEYRFALQVMRC